MLNRFKLDPVAKKTAFHAAFALTLAASFAIYFHWELFWWAVFVTFLSIQPDTGSSIRFLLARFVGTYLGGIIGAIIGLTIQHPWIYYCSTVMFVFLGTSFFLKTEFSWAGYLCVIVGLAILLLGPSYPNGVIYYAIERCLQITFVLGLVSLMLIVMRVQRAYKLLRVKIPSVLDQVKQLWSLVYEG